jgi:hypothetical protein
LKTITIAAGRLEGSGTVSANVASSATIAPGLTIGTLNITGDLTVAAGSDLRFDLGGLTQGTQYDLLTEAGTTPLSFNGTLSLTLVNGFQPNEGDTFTLLTSNQPLTGAFTNVTNGLVFATDGISEFQVAFAGDALVVTFIPEPSGAELALVAASIVCARLRPRRSARAGGV